MVNNLNEVKERPGIFTIGMFWSYWREEHLPNRYRGNPRAYDQAQMDLIVKAGGTGIPIGLAWCMIEPEQGEYRWEAADAQVEDAWERGLEMTAYIGHTPNWAIPEAPPGEEKPAGHRIPPDERYEDEFREYCRRTAARYRGKVRRYVFWNEPNGCSWIRNGCNNSDSFPLYTRWLKRAAAALKEGNPDCIIAAAALDYNAGVPDGWKYIQGIYDEGGGDCFQAIDIHPYSPKGVNWQGIRDTRRVMVENGDAHKELWICEYGWQDADDSKAIEYLKNFLNEIRKDEYRYISHARYLVISDLNEGYYGLTDIDLNPRPLYWAYREIPKSILPPGSARDMGELIELNSPGAATGDHDGDECSIQRPKPDLEYGEKMHLKGYVPAEAGDCDCPVEYAWHVDGRSAGSDEVLALEERPDSRKRISVKLEARRGGRSFEARTELIAYPFVTNNFAVLLREKWEIEDSGVLEIETGKQLKLSTRILNPTSHDLSFSWRVNGNEVMRGNEEYRVFSFIPSIFADAAGRVEVVVSCVNAGLQSSDTMEIQILP